MYCCSRVHNATVFAEHEVDPERIDWPVSQVRSKPEGGGLPRMHFR